MTRTARAVGLLVVILLTGTAACGRQPNDRGSTVSTPSEWHPVRVGDAAVLAVPPDAEEQRIQPLDSIVGMLVGDGYEIVYDYGRSGEDLSLYRDEPGYAEQAREVDGRSGRQVTFHPSGSPWRVVRILQASDGEEVLTVRVSCEDDAVCAVADAVFDTVRFGAR